MRSAAPSGRSCLRSGEVAIQPIKCIGWSIFHPLDRVTRSLNNQGLIFYIQEKDNYRRKRWRVHWIQFASNYDTKFAQFYCISVTTLHQKRCNTRPTSSWPCCNTAILSSKCTWTFEVPPLPNSPLVLSQTHQKFCFLQSSLTAVILKECNWN